MLNVIIIAIVICIFLHSLLHTNNTDLPHCHSSPSVHTVPIGEGYNRRIFVEIHTIEARWRVVANTPPKYDGRLVSLLRYAPYI